MEHASKKSSFRVVLVVPRTGHRRRPRRPMRRVTARPATDRSRAFDERMARIESQLAVLEKDTKGGVTAVGRRLRVTQLGFTGDLLFAHVEAAEKWFLREPVLSRLRDALAQRADDAAVQLDRTALAAAPVDLERVVAALFLYYEIRMRLAAPGKSSERGGRRAGGAAWNERPQRHATTPALTPAPVLCQDLTPYRVPSP